MPTPGFPSNHGSIYYREGSAYHWRDANTGIIGKSPAEIRARHNRSTAPKQAVARVIGKRVTFQGKTYRIIKK